MSFEEKTPLTTWTLLISQPFYWKAKQDFLQRAAHPNFARSLPSFPITSMRISQANQELSEVLVNAFMLLKLIKTHLVAIPSATLPVAS